MSEVCRLCLSKRFVSQQIFEEEIYQRLKSFLPIPVSKTDDLPKKVCKTCVLKINDIYDFVQQTVNVQMQLVSRKSDKLNTSHNSNDENDSTDFVIKKEPFEDHKDSTHIIISKQILGGALNYISKSTQTDLGLLTNEDSVVGNSSEITDKSDPGTKIEETHFKEIASEIEEDLDLNYSSEDDLALSSVLQSSKTKNVQSKNVSKNCENISTNIVLDKKSHKKSRKCNYPNKKNTKSDINKTTSTKKERLLDDGDKYFYPEGTAEELKKWQCLTCFSFLKTRIDLLQHYKEHQENPSNFVPKAMTEDSDDLMLPDKLDSSKTSENVDCTRVGPKLGLNYVQINNSDFGDATAYQCLKCLKMFLNKRAVTRHLICHDDTRPFPCNLCGRAYKRAYEILLHGRVHNGFKTLFCKYPSCDYKTVYRGALHNHIKRHEAVGNFKYTCEVCNKGFDVLTWYNEHKNVHMGVRPFTCDICGKGFAYSRYLTSHRKSVHPEDEEKSGKQLLHRCPSCPRQFSHWSRLRAHIKRDHEEQRKPGDGVGAAVLCDICGKGLSTKEHLKFHRRTHTGEKPFICRTCGKGFVKKCNLTLHERVHSGEKPHVCSHCGKAFSQRSTLVIHERYHSGARPYVCTICKKGFVAKGLLSMHQKTCL